MSKVLAWIRSILCFLCFFQVFLQLTPKESYRKYLKFFGNLIESCNQTFFIRIIVRDSI